LAVVNYERPNRRVEARNDVPPCAALLAIRSGLALLTCEPPHPCEHLESGVQGDERVIVGSVKCGSRAAAPAPKSFGSAEVLRGLQVLAARKCRLYISRVRYYAHLVPPPNGGRSTIPGAAAVFIP